MIAEVSPVKLPSNECHCTSLMIGQHWHQAITRANETLDLCHYMASLGHNELTLILEDHSVFFQGNLAT